MHNDTGTIIVGDRWWVHVRNGNGWTCGRCRGWCSNPKKESPTAVGVKRVD